MTNHRILAAAVRFDVTGSRPGDTTLRLAAAASAKRQRHLELAAMVVALGIVRLVGARVN